MLHSNPSPIQYAQLIVHTPSQHMNGNMVTGVNMDNLGERRGGRNGEEEVGMGGGGGGGGREESREICERTYILLHTRIDEGTSLHQC